MIDLMKNDVWSEADIANRARETVASVVSEARQNELRTIMIGHVASLRTATADELAEIMRVKTLVETADDNTRAARLDMALLKSVMALERANVRLSLPVVEDDETDTAERAAAQAIVDSASTAVCELCLLRNPAPTPVEVIK